MMEYRVEIIGEPKVVEESAFYMRQPLKKYYGYDRSLNDWIELAAMYPSQIDVRAADVPLMRRYYHVKDDNSGVLKISNYTYGNYNPEKDYQSVIVSTDESYNLYKNEFEYLWNKGSHDIGRI